MNALTWRLCLVLLLGVLLGSGSMAPQSVSDDVRKSSAAGHDVVLTLKIADKQSGLNLEAKRSVPKGSNAFEVLQEIVGVKYKRFPELGAFVTSLCGVDAPEGMVWTFNVDSKWSQQGIANVTLDQDTLIEWTTR